jgi:hypothetical protein
MALAGGGFLALERAVPGTGAPASREPSAEPYHAAPPGWYVVALAIARDERPAWEARLVERGVAVERRTPHSIFFRDPEGNRLALTHWPEAAP